MYGPANALFDGRFQVPTFEEIIDFAAAPPMVRDAGT